MFSILRLPFGELACLVGEHGVHEHVFLALGQVAQLLGKLLVGRGDQRAGSDIDASGCSSPSTAFWIAGSILPAPCRSNRRAILHLP